MLFVHSFPQTFNLPVNLIYKKNGIILRASTIEENASMTIQTFNSLHEHQKVQMIFDADKITEKVDDEANYQLFRIDNFFIEAKTSLEGKFKRTFTFYTLNELPAEYASELISIPLVTVNTEKPQTAANSLRFKTRKQDYFRANR